MLILNSIFFLYLTNNKDCNYNNSGNNNNNNNNNSNTINNNQNNNNKTLYLLIKGLCHYDGIVKCFKLITQDPRSSIIRGSFELSGNLCGKSGQKFSFSKWR